MANRLKEQDRIKDLKARAEKKRIEQIKEANLQGIERLESEIGSLENTIRGCKWDLTHSCKDNPIVINKMKNAENNLNNKIKELNELKNGNKTNI